MERTTQEYEAHLAFAEHLPCNLSGVHGCGMLNPTTVTWVASRGVSPSCVLGWGTTATIMATETKPINPRGGGGGGGGGGNS